MRYLVLSIMFLMVLPLGSGKVFAASSDVDVQNPLITDIRIEGFVLQDKSVFVKLFKPYRHKHLSTADMDGLLAQIQDIYQKEGYAQLVAISYQVDKHRLIFTALMTS